MTEKEFIVGAIELIDYKWKGIIPNYDAVEEWLDEYLAEFHKKYDEVEFHEVSDIEPAPHQWCQEHQGKRFRADDPNQEKLGMALNYKCLHGVEWIVTGECLDALRFGQFRTSCDCDPPKHAKLINWDAPVQEL